MSTLDCRYQRTGQKYRLGEKVLCYTIDEPYFHHKNMWQSPNDVYLGLVINYNTKTKKYIVRIQDWPKGQFGTKSELKENQLQSWEHHVPYLKEWGL